MSLVFVLIGVGVVALLGAISFACWYVFGECGEEEEEQELPPKPYPQQQPPPPHHPHYAQPLHPPPPRSVVAPNASVSGDGSGPASLGPTSQPVPPGPTDPVPRTILAPTPEPRPVEEDTYIVDV